MERQIRRIITLLISLLISVPTMVAQQEVKGVVVDETGKGLQYVNVVAIQMPDSVFMGGIITDETGGFHFTDLPQESLLVFSSIGYQKQVNRATPQMRVVLQEETTMLSEVSVVSRKLVARPTGYTMTLDHNPLVKSKSVLQALNMLPNIDVRDGQINILGRGVEAIYIDGLPIQDEKALKAIPTDQISHIEVDYTSSTREGAGRSGGVLRIFLKKQSKGGWTTNIGADTYYMPHYGWRGGGVNNYFSAQWEKLTIRNSINVSKILYLGDEENTLLNKVTQQEQKSLNKYRNWESLFSNRLSLSYDITPKHFVATSLQYRHILGRPEYQTTNLINDTETYQLQHTPTHLLQWVTNYKWSINPTSSLELSSDLLYRKADKKNKEQRPLFYDAQMNQNTHMTRLRGEYKHSFTDVGNLSVGTDLRWINQDESSTQVVPTAMQSNSPSLFTTFSGELGFLQYEAGLRLQHNETKTTQAGEEYRYKYTGLFPSLSIMYLINPEKGHLVTLSVERLLENIPYSAISGYRQYSGPYEYTIGNPSLHTPIGTQAFALLSLWGKLNVIFLGIHYKDPIYFDRRVDKQNPQISYTIPMNGRYQFGFMSILEWRQQVTKWWDTKTSASLRSNSADAGAIYKNQTSVFFRHNSDFHIAQDFGAGLELYYEPTSHYLDRKMETVANVSGNLFKTFLNGDLDLRLNFVLWGKQRTTITENESLRFRYANQSHSPSVNLTLNYRLSGGKKVKALTNTRELQQYETTQDLK